MINKGFTLIELSVVVAIAGILLGLVLTSFSKLNQKEILDKEVLLAVSILNEARANTLAAKDNAIESKNFDNQGNFGFGIREHIDLAKVKYDPKLGIRGFDVLVTLKRPGYRVKRRKIDKRRIPLKHVIPREEAIEFVKQKFGVVVE